MPCKLIIKLSIDKRTHPLRLTRKVWRFQKGI